MCNRSSRCWSMMITPWRRFATKTVTVPHFDKEIIQKFEDETMHPRHHPGRMKFPVYQVPERIYEGIKNVLSDHSIASLKNDGIVLTNYLRERQKPAEKIEVAEKTRMLQGRVEEKYDIPATPNINPKIIQKATKEVILSLLRHTYVWNALDFSDHLCYPYLVSRSAAEYAIVRSIFAEISKREPTFQPESIFDFGSGVGSVIWASHGVWEDSVKEYFCVDSSPKMNEIAEDILSGSVVDGKPFVKAQVFHRQFLPTSSQRRYNVVVSAFSLLEFPDARTRIETIRNLWGKTQDYLVLVELGTKAGFQVVNEARDYLLGLYSTKPPEGHVFAPCPHDYSCPKAASENHCFFQRKFIHLPFDNKLRQSRELYSYVVLKKGNRNPEEPKWPRIVQPVLVRCRHAHCRVCSAEGKFEDLHFSKSKHPTRTYWCVRMSEWGDRLPLSALTKETVSDLTSSTKEAQPTEDSGESISQENIPLPKENFNGSRSSEPERYQDASGLGRHDDEPRDKNV